MAIFATIDTTDNIVQNIVVGESLESIIEYVGFAIEVTESTGIANIGWIWDPNTRKFTEPK